MVPAHLLQHPKLRWDEAVAATAKDDQDSFNLVAANDEAGRAKNP
jgi:hypothetical protein